MKRRLPVGIPCSYLDLVVLYRQPLEDAAKGLGISLDELQASAREAKLLENFNVEEHYPLKLTWDEARSVAGMTSPQWEAFLRNTVKPPKGSRLPWTDVHPYLAPDYDDGPAEPTDRNAIYWGGDILRATDFMDENGLKRGRSSCPVLVDAFMLTMCDFLESARRVKLAASSARMTSSLAEMESEAEGVWPAELPRNDTELVKMYSEYVFEQVRRVSKIKTDEELGEVTQQVWYNIVRGRVLERFIEAAQTKLPRTLTTTEVLGYLGITSRQWVSAVEFSKKSDNFWIPLPVKGTHESTDALYLTEDVHTLDQSGFLEGARNAPRQHPEFSGRGFKSYLTQAVKNHFKNLLRTRSRRHKERGVDAKSVLTPNSSGTFHKAYTSEEDVNWEENLVDGHDVDIESMLDLKAMLDRHGVDPRTENGLNVLDHVTRGLTVKSAVKFEQRQGVRSFG